MNRLPAAVCFSIDDVHPSPVAIEALSHVRWLQERHPRLRVTLFTTPDWQTLDPYPTRPIARIPWLRDRVHTVRVHPRGTFRLDRHAAFCDFLAEWRGAEIAMHGLHHVTRGMRPVLEFANASAAECRTMIDEADAIFRAAKLKIVRGFAPPGWHVTPALLQALRDSQIRFFASARDLETDVANDAVAAGSGLRGVPLFAPAEYEGLIHIPTNFQATSTIDRARNILASGGLLSIKAHLLAESGGYRALDGLTIEYRDRLDELFSTIEREFGDRVFWTSMGEIAERWTS
jgi:peptidoglycan/xylan/chitin deacetylase (PgdA/CDA1 family)